MLGEMQIPSRMMSSDGINDGSRVLDPIIPV
jgi:hypothetical protein